MKKLRKAVSLTALVSFAVLIITSVILYIGPQGRVAYWAGWHLMGLTKTQWGNLHINVGLLFLIAGGLHIYLNWTPIVSYLKDKARSLKVFTRDFNIALILTVAVVAGTLFELPPFLWVCQLTETFQDAAARKYGEPPYGHAELSSLKTFTARMGFNPADAMARLKAAEIHVTDPDQTLQDIAYANGVTPQVVYLAMKPEVRSGQTPALPPTPPGGMGNRTLADLCGEYGLHIPSVLLDLEANGIRAAPDQTIKEIAAENGKGPLDVYDALRRAAEGNGDEGDSETY